MKLNKPCAVWSLLAGVAFALGICRTSRADLKVFDITQHGAVGDGKTLNSKAIQATIDACAQGGGGTVIVPKGEFLSGAIFLRAGVNLELLQDAVLKGSADIKDYPKGNARIEGHFETWPAALINADKVDHLQITGPGTLDGNGLTYWQEFGRRRKEDRKTTNLSVERPRLMCLQNCQDVQVTGVTFNNSGFWNLHLYRCSKVTVDGCRFQSPHDEPGPAPSTDGIDVDSSQDVTISKCFFSVGDDDIALKGSKGPFALQDKESPPVERIHIFDCVFERGGGIVTVGSEATIVRDVEVEHCTTRKVAVLRLKLRPDTPQQYENIHLRDITMEDAEAVFSIAPWKQYFDLQGQAPPKSLVRNITLSNLKGTCKALGKVTGNADTQLNDIVVKDSDFKLTNTKSENVDSKNLRFENVSVNRAPMPPPTPATAP